MKKITILLLMSVISIISYGQKNMISYKGMGMYSVFTSQLTYKVLKRVPLGKRCDLTYFTSIKRWDIDSYDSDNKINNYIWYYIKTYSDGSMLMEDFVHTKFIVVNTINKDGKLKGIMQNSDVDGAIISLEFDNIILRK